MKWTDNYQKKYKWPMNIWINSQLLWPQWKYKAKLHWDFTSPQTKMAVANNTTTNDIEDAWERQQFYSVDGNVNYCNHCGKQYVGPSKN
jgi:hypothetical protein